MNAPAPHVRPLEVAAARVRLQPDALPRVRAWAAHMAAHRDEALASLVSEGVVTESVFLDSTPSGDFLVVVMRSASQEQAEAVAAKSVAAIDAYHAEFKRSAWASVSRLELLLDLTPTREAS